MKNERSAQIPTIKRWCRRKTSISIKTNPSHLASFLCKSSPVTAWESDTETTVKGVVFLRRACKETSVKFRINCQQRQQPVLVLLCYWTFLIQIPLHCSHCQHALKRQPVVNRIFTLGNLMGICYIKLNTTLKQKKRALVKRRK